VIDTLEVDGSVRSSLLELQTGNMRTEVRDVSGRYILRDGNVDINNFSAELLGGSVEGSLNIRDVAGAANSRLQAALHGIGLRPMQALLSRDSLREVAITGTANANVEASWAKTLDRLSSRADANIEGTIAPARDANGNVPLSGEIHLQYAATTKQITF